ncbi:very-long-chain 3-oxoacyl-CoA reductase-like [Oppia nitens]|uniref:very-long-chain 3-oxoacyl-CoA reductase-like n=1 Tax=Oppia nitens TaxID=1686743 RepID=UPI0023DC4BA3|nr:very-long-chain 3-oxoacyl-CoA reductase-like [Oppia nitens]
MTEFNIYEIIGKSVCFLIAVYYCYKLLKGIYTSFLANTLGLGVVWKPDHNTWAVITGATDGIGLEYANRLAQMGYCLLIISRNEDKLQKVKSQLLMTNLKCKQIKILAVDFTKDNIYQQISRELDSLQVIDVLVNNVGMSSKTGEYFSKIENIKEFIQSIINCNVVSMTKMISMVLPQMVGRGRGIIINLSSLSATNPVPLLAIYSASKVYCDYLSRSLHYEYKDKGIIIQSVLPGFVSTNMSAMRPSFSCPTAVAYVNEAMKTVGVESRTYGHYAHKLLGFLQDSISTILGPNYNSYFAFKHLLKLRSRYYHKHGLKDQ